MRYLLCLSLLAAPAFSVACSNASTWHEQAECRNQQIGGCKPEPPKFPSPQFQPRHERIEVDDLVWDANKGVVSRNPRKFCRKRSQAKFPAAETIRHGLSRMFWLCKPGISANGVPVP